MTIVKKENKLRAISLINNQIRTLQGNLKYLKDINGNEKSELAVQSQISILKYILSLIKDNDNNDINIKEKNNGKSMDDKKIRH